MATENESAELSKVDVEHVAVAPAGGENVDGSSVHGGETDNGGAEGAEGASGGGEGEGSEADAGQTREQLVRRQPQSQQAGDENANGGAGSGGQPPKPVDGETPRERALRQKVETLQSAARRSQGAELLGGNAPARQAQQPAPATQPAKKELPAERQAVLAKYKPAEIAAIKEVLPIIAEDLGFVRADQLSAQSYNDRAQQELDTFLQDHQEYLSENDKDGVLWGQFKNEFQMFKPPENPKDYAKIFNRIHSDIFNIKPAPDRGTIAAGERKVQVASHASASVPNRSSNNSSQRTVNANGLRLDALSGFTDEEKESIASRAG